MDFNPVRGCFMPEVQSARRAIMPGFYDKQNPAHATLYALPTVPAAWAGRVRRTISFRRHEQTKACPGNMQRYTWPQPSCSREMWIYQVNGIDYARTNYHKYNEK